MTGASGDQRDSLSWSFAICVTAIGNIFPKVKIDGDVQEVYKAIGILRLCKFQVVKVERVTNSVTSLCL
jgi:hypothetical protein